MSDRTVTAESVSPQLQRGALAAEDWQLTLRAADWLITDGTGIVLVSKLLGGQVRGRGYRQRHLPGGLGL